MGRASYQKDQPLVHQFEKFAAQDQAWLDTKTHWKENVKNFCEGWFKTGLEDRAVTRDFVGAFRFLYLDMKIRCSMSGLTRRLAIFLRQSNGRKISASLKNGRNTGRMTRPG